MDEQEFVRAELQDQADVVGKLSPIEYAKLRGMKPQLVYYYIRTGRIKEERCVCGRRVLDVRDADEAFQAQAQARRRRSGQPLLEPDAPEEPEG